MANPTIKMKVGDTLLGNAIHKDTDGQPVDLSTAGIAIVSAVLSPDGRTRHPLEVTIDPDQVANKGKFTILGQSSAWTPGKGWKWDTRYTDSTGFSWSDETLRIDVAEQIS